MTKTLAVEDVLRILKAGRFSDLKGGLEDGKVECKSEIYTVTDDHQKQELAKDVSALANVDGGIILLGVHTKRDNTRAIGDQITDLSPFSEGLVDPEQYHKILSDWVYPQLEDVDIVWHPSDKEKTKGLVSILVPPQSPARRPFLITKLLDDGGKKRTTLIGYAERRRANAEPKSLEELHSLIRYGNEYGTITGRLDSLQQGIESIQQIIKASKVETPLTQSTPQKEQVGIPLPYGGTYPLSSFFYPDLLSERIGLILSELDLGPAHPAYVLAFTPEVKIEIPSLFASRNAQVVSLLEQPPDLRLHGFGLGTGAQAKIIEGVRRSAATPQFKSLNLWADGTFIFAADGGIDFLCWGSHASMSGTLRINPIALLESAYLFSSLGHAIYQHAQPYPTGGIYCLAIQNMTVNDTPCGLIPGPVGSHAWTFGTDIARAPDSRKRFDVAYHGAQINPGRVTFDLARQLYHWFGLDDEAIPYRKQAGDKKEIDPEQIKVLI